ncbi:glycosyltransferase [Gemmatimonas groenlandica]|uniref:Glycosyltransferase n=1 Tax=Gemmatimonas groenlandica TaxID=2732249 RepID=A0A6M4IQ23_9BACT|nr:glycosyltransferase [Gemmatimonas groenlandica]QJR36205.1 glycosyltransferase [Gemmatimonas groenlandica]
MNPRVSIIVPIKNKVTFLSRALTSVSLACAEHGAAEIVLIENGSTDGSRELAQSFEGTASVLYSSASTISAVRNAGARHAQGDLLVFLDSDIVVPTNYLAMVEVVIGSTPADAVGYPVRPPDDGTWVEWQWYLLNVAERSGVTHFINSGSIAVTRQAFERISGFPEDFETGEDYEFCRRLVSTGYQIHRDERLSVVHLDNPKTIAAFFRKEVWYGLGMLKASGEKAMNRPTLMTLAHILLLLICIASALVNRFLLTFILLNAVPVATLVYRLRIGGRVGNGLQQLLLLHVFYCARIVGLVRGLRRR